MPSLQSVTSNLRSSVGKARLKVTEANGAFKVQLNSLKTMTTTITADPKAVEFNARIEIAAHHICQGKKIVVAKAMLLYYKATVDILFTSVREQLMKTGGTKTPGEYIYLALLEKQDKYVIKRVYPTTK
jgi:isochorismate synthase EntC